MAEPLRSSTNGRSQSTRFFGLADDNEEPQRAEELPSVLDASSVDAEVEADNDEAAEGDCCPFATPAVNLAKTHAAPKNTWWT